MTIVLRGMKRETAAAILAGERPGDVRVPDDYPTELRHSGGGGAGDKGARGLGGLPDRRAHNA